MALNAETEAVLKGLEGRGFDLSSVRTQAAGNPLLENAANSELGGGILRREEFTRFKTAKETEVTNLQNRVRELAALHDSLPSFEGNKDLYQAALEKIEVLESNMITDGWKKEDIESLTFNEKSGLARMIAQAKEKEAAAIVKKEGTEVPNDKDYIDSNTFQLALANGLGGTVLSSIEIQFELDRARQLGVEVTRDKLQEFQRNLMKGFETKKPISEITDETFGLPAIQLAKSKEAEDTRVESRARELAAEQLKEQGIPASRLSRNRPLTPIDTMRTRFTNANGEELKIEGEGGTTVINGRTLPVNKFGNIEHYKLRSGREGVGERVAHASAYMNELEQKKPDLFEEPY